jgi:hypothetical protein
MGMHRWIVMYVADKNYSSSEDQPKKKQAYAYETDKLERTGLVLGVTRVSRVNIETQT